MIDSNLDYVALLLKYFHRLDLTFKKTLILANVLVAQKLLNNYDLTCSKCSLLSRDDINNIFDEDVLDDIDDLMEQQYLHLKEVNHKFYFYCTNLCEKLFEFYQADLQEHVMHSLSSRVEIFLNIKLSSADIDLIETLKNKEYNDDLILHCFAKVYYKYHELDHRLITDMAYDLKENTSRTDLFPLLNNT